MARSVNDNHRIIVRERRLVRLLVVNDNVVVREFQERGTPHDHSVAIVAYVVRYTSMQSRPVENEILARMILELLEQRYNADNE